jgi:hypothetical protein
MVGTSFIAFSSFHAHGSGFITMSFVIKTLFVRKFEEMVPRQWWIRMFTHGGHFFINKKIKLIKNIKKLIKYKK